MKTIIAILLFTLCGYTVNAQRMAMHERQLEKPATSTENSSEKAPQFVFHNYGMDLSHSDLSDYSEHFLGDNIAQKKHAFQSIYVRHYSATLGFSDNTMEIYKPAIYNAVVKVENYLKKAIRRKEINQGEAVQELSKCLDVAYLAYYEENTDELEQTLKKAKEPEELLHIFQSILIKE